MKKWKSEDYKEFLVAYKKEAVEARKTVASIWDDCWNIYRNTQDYSDKEAWQSQVCIPEGMGAVRKAQSLIRSSLTRPKDFFNIEGGLQPAIMKSRMQELFRDTEVNFVPNIVEGIGSGLVMGISLVKNTYRMSKKTFIETDAKGKINRVTKEKPVPCYEVKDPRTTFFLLDDPLKFIIEEEMYPLSEVLSWADQKEKGYDKKAIAEMKKEDFCSEPTEEVEKRLRDLDIDEANNKYRKQVLIQRFWGNVVDEFGTTLHENCFFELANGEYLILPPKKNPYWHGKLPFVACSPLQLIFRKTGQSILEGMRTIQFAINDIVNMQLDALLYELLGIPEIDSSKLLNPAEVTALIPGRLIRRSPGASPGPAVTIERPTSFSNAPVTMVELLRRAGQNSHFITDILMGLPTVKGENATATEINKKGSESSQAFQMIAMDFEDGLIVPLLEMTAYNILQFDDFLDTGEPDLAKFKNMNREQRIATLQGNYKFSARGITSFFEMQENLQNIVGVLQIVAKIPIGSMAIRWPQLLYKIFEYGRVPDAEKLLLTEKEIAQLLQSQQAQQAQQAQQQIAIQAMGDERDRQAKMAEKQLEGQFRLEEVKEKGSQQIKKEIVKMLGEPDEIPQKGKQ